MLYKVGDEVVLRDERQVGIDEVEMSPSGEKCYVARAKRHWNRLRFIDDDIDHEKTAELHNCYQGELERIVAEKNNREHVDAIEPAHYRQGNIDRIEVWYQTYPFDGFRWAMKSHIDKYIHRYESKGGIEDLDKATYFIKRLKEKETEECSN